MCLTVKKEIDNASRRGCQEFVESNWLEKTGLEDRRGKKEKDQYSPVNHYLNKQR